jgi:hypothetical protein
MTLVSGTRVGSKWNCSPTRCVVTKNQCRNLIASFLLLFRLAARGEDFRGHITAELSLFVVLLGQDRGDKDDDRARPGKCRRRPSACVFPYSGAPAPCLPILPPTPASLARRDSLRQGSAWQGWVSTARG